MNFRLKWNIETKWQKFYIEPILWAYYALAPWAWVLAPSTPKFFRAVFPVRTARCTSLFHLFVTKQKKLIQRLNSNINYNVLLVLYNLCYMCQFRISAKLTMLISGVQKFTSLESISTLSCNDGAYAKKLVFFQLSWTLCLLYKNHFYLRNLVKFFDNIYSMKNDFFCQLFKKFVLE